MSKLKKISWQQKMKNRIAQLTEEKRILIDCPDSIQASEIKAMHKLTKNSEISLWYGSSQWHCKNDGIISQIEAAQV